MRKRLFNADKKKMENDKEAMKMEGKENEYEDFFMNRVVTRDVVRDSFQGIRNFFGFRLRSYENMIQRAADEMTEDMRMQYEVKWYRFSINPLSNQNAVMVILYGVGKYKEDINQLLEDAAK